MTGKVEPPRGARRLLEISGPGARTRPWSPLVGRSALWVGLVAYLRVLYRAIEHERAIDLSEVVVTADTVVILDGEILNKPKDRDDAIRILSSLSGKTHQVMTGVSIVSRQKEEHFDDTTEVTFRDLTLEEIEFYIDHFQPYDKAGAYGAQDTLPEGMNPCSQEEMRFLRSIEKEYIIEQTVTPPPADKRIVVIKQISGSYFNVMGLPIHIVYSHLDGW